MGGNSKGPKELAIRKQPNNELVSRKIQKLLGH